MSLEEQLCAFRRIAGSEELSWDLIHHVDIQALEQVKPDLQLMKALLSHLSNANLHADTLRRCSLESFTKVCHAYQIALQFSLWSQHIMREQMQQQINVLTCAVNGQGENERKLAEAYHTAEQVAKQTWKKVVQEALVERDQFSQRCVQLEETLRMADRAVASLRDEGQRDRQKYKQARGVLSQMEEELVVLRQRNAKLESESKKFGTMKQQQQLQIQHQQEQVQFFQQQLKQLQQQQLQQQQQQQQQRSSCCSGACGRCGQSAGPAPVTVYLHKEGQQVSHRCPSHPHGVSYRPHRDYQHHHHRRRRHKKQHSGRGATSRHQRQRIHTSPAYSDSSYSSASSTSSSSRSLSSSRDANAAAAARRGRRNEQSRTRLSESQRNELDDRHEISKKRQPMKAYSSGSGRHTDADDASESQFVRMPNKGPRSQQDPDQDQPPRQILQQQQQQEEEELRRRQLPPPSPTTQYSSSSYPYRNEKGGPLDHQHHRRPHPASQHPYQGRGGHADSDYEEHVLGNDKHASDHAHPHRHFDPYRAEVEAHESYSSAPQRQPGSPVGRGRVPSPREHSSTSVSSSYHQRMTTPPQYHLRQQGLPLPPSPNTMGLIDQMKRSILPPGAPLQGLTPPKEEQQYYDNDDDVAAAGEGRHYHQLPPPPPRRESLADPPPVVITRLLTPNSSTAFNDLYHGGGGGGKEDDPPRGPEQPSRSSFPQQPGPTRAGSVSAGPSSSLLSRPGEPAPARAAVGGGPPPLPSSVPLSTASLSSQDQNRRSGDRADTPKGLPPPMLRLTPPSSPPLPPAAVAAAAAAGASQLGLAPPELAAFPSMPRDSSSSHREEGNHSNIEIAGVGREATAGAAAYPKLSADHSSSALGIGSGITSSPTRTNTTKMPSPETTASLLYHHHNHSGQGGMPAPTSVGHSSSIDVPPSTTTAGSKPAPQQRPTSPLPKSSPSSQLQSQSPSLLSPGSRSPAALASPRADIREDASGSSIMDGSGGAGGPQAKKKKKPMPNFSVSSVLLSPNKGKDRNGNRPSSSSLTTGTNASASMGGGYVGGGAAKPRALSPPQTVLDRPNHSIDPSSLSTSAYQKNQETPLLRPSPAVSKYQHPSANTSSVDNSFLKGASTAPKTPSGGDRSTDADLVPPPPTKPLTKFVSLDDMPASVAARTGGGAEAFSKPAPAKTPAGAGGVGLDNGSKLSSTGPASTLNNRNDTTTNNSGSKFASTAKSSPNPSFSGKGSGSVSSPLPSKNSPTDKRGTTPSPTLPPKTASVSLDDLPASAAVRKASRDSSPACHDVPEGSPLGDRPKSLSVSFDEVMTSAVRASSVNIANSTLSQFSERKPAVRKVSVDSTSKSRSPPADPTKVYCRHCDKEINKAGRYVHEGNCDKRQVKCPKCTKSFLATELATHLCIAVKKATTRPTPLPSSSSADGDGSGRAQKGSDSKREETATRSGVGSLNASVNGSSDIRASSVMLQETQRELQALLEEEAAMEAKKKAAAAGK